MLKSDLVNRLEAQVTSGHECSSTSFVTFRHRRSNISSLTDDTGARPCVMSARGGSAYQATKVCQLWVLVVLLASVVVSRGADSMELVRRPWFEARSTHFHTYSCGVTQEVAKLTARLEQFHVAYSSLAGTQAVASPPIVVLAFPDHATLEQFVPLYQGKPTTLSGFFHRGTDENLIVLSLTNRSGGGLETIFHEFAHLLLRHNQRLWPLWLSEGMADMYASFEVTEEHWIRIGKPREAYLPVLGQEQLMPLRDLFAVSHDSPQYNERDQQGIFYAESWLLTHYLMAGQNGALRPRLAEFTALLKKGQIGEEAFTNAFRISLRAMENQLRHYLQEARFEPLALMVQPNLLAAQPLATRGLTPVESCFRLGDELFRIGRFDGAESYFSQAKRIAPLSPLPYEGLGLLAAERGQHSEAVDYLQEATQRGSSSFLAHYTLGRERFRLTAKEPDTYSRIGEQEANEIRAELNRSLTLMPNFAPAHHLLGFLELVQGDSRLAEQHLRQAVQLEPENQSYSLSLAQAQLFRKEFDAARETLQPLCLPNVETQVRKDAEALLEKAAGTQVPH
jgi:tetratricopeptide (TPR) repeat protein